MTTHPILVPLDGSALSEAALPFAMTISRIEDCEIELLAVAERLGLTPEAGRLETLVTEGLDTHLRHVAERLRVAGLTASARVRGGVPADLIVREAEELQSRLIVMTTRGQGGLTRWLVGSVAEKVMRLAPCPVLLVRPADTAVDIAHLWHPRRLLVPLDGSAVAEQALVPAYRWAKALDAEVLLARVQPWLATRVVTPDGYVPDLARWDEELAVAATAYLAEQAAFAPAGLAVRTELLRGDPAGNLVDLAEHQADLVVMTSHGRSGVERLVLGSVADRMVRAGVPVCIVHPVSAETGAAGAHTATAEKR